MDKDYRTIIAEIKEGDRRVAKAAFKFIKKQEKLTEDFDFAQEEYENLFYAVTEHVYWNLYNEEQK